MLTHAMNILDSQNLYDRCINSQEQNSDDCEDCSTQKAPRDAFYERERSTGDYILEGLVSLPPSSHVWKCLSTNKCNEARLYCLQRYVPQGARSLHNEV